MNSLYVLKMQCEGRPQEYKGDLVSFEDDGKVHCNYPGGPEPFEFDLDSPEFAEKMEAIYMQCASLLRTQRDNR